MAVLLELFIYICIVAVWGVGEVCAYRYKRSAKSASLSSAEGIVARELCVGFPEPRDRGVGLFLLMVIRMFLLSLVVSQISLTFLVILSL